MSALILLSAIGIWIGVGWFAWKVLVYRRIHSRLFRAVLTVSFLVAWGLAPWLDEMLGAVQFERACAAMPAVKFMGPVSVGAGPFFDEAGRPKWRTRDEFSLINRSAQAFDQLFERRVTVTRVSSFPILIEEERLQYFVRSTGALLIELPSLTSRGGWLKRSTGWGAHAPYQCPWRGGFVSQEKWIKF